MGMLLLFCSLACAGALRTLQGPEYDVDEFSQQAEAMRDALEAEARDLALHGGPAGSLLREAEEVRSRSTAPAGQGERFHFVITTSPATLSPLSIRIMESTLYHHPTAEVTLHATMSPYVVSFNELLAPIRNKGYNIQARAYDVRHDCLARIQGDPSFVSSRAAANDFAHKLSHYALTKYWPNQQSNLVRLCILYYEGGMYLDNDAMLVRPVAREWRNVMGLQGRNTANNAVLRFQAKNPFLRDCIAELLATFQPQTWGFNGPLLVTRVWKRGSYSSEELTVLPDVAFSPVSWRSALKLFWTLPTSDEDVQKTEQRILNGSTVVHFYFKLGVPYSKVETLGKKLARKYCILCDRDPF